MTQEADSWVSGCILFLKPQQIVDQHSCDLLIPNFASLAVDETSVQDLWPPPSSLTAACNLFTCPSLLTPRCCNTSALTLGDSPTSNRSQSDQTNLQIGDVQLQQLLASDVILDKPFAIFVEVVRLEPWTHVLGPPQLNCKTNAALWHQQVWLSWLRLAAFTYRVSSPKNRTHKSLNKTVDFNFLSFSEYTVLWGVPQGNCTPQ